MSNGPIRGARAVNGQLPPAWRTFAEHFAIHGDWQGAYRAAYPRAANWKPTALRSSIFRMRHRPEVMTYIHQLRAPVMASIAYDYEWMVKETARQYYAASASGEIKGALIALRQMARLLGLDFPELSRLHARSRDDEDEPLSDDEYAELKERMRAEIAAEIA